MEKIEIGKVLVALVGPPLSGKTTLGLELSRRTNLVYLDGDVAKRNIFLPWDELPAWEQRVFAQDLNPSEYLNGREPLPGDMQLFANTLAYQANHDTAEVLLRAGQPVVIASTYSGEPYHSMLKGTARRAQTRLEVFNLIAPDNAIVSRLEQRVQGGSISITQSFERYQRSRDIFRLIEGVEVTPIDTGLPLGDCVDQVIGVLTR